MSPAPTGLRDTCRHLLEPLSIAAIVTWLLVAFEQVAGLWARNDARLWPVSAVLLLFLLTFFGREFARSRELERAMLLLQFVMAIADVALVQSGAGPILGVIAAAQLPFLFGTRATVAIVVASLCAYYAVFEWLWTNPRALFTTLLFGAFQFFALLTARLAHAAELQRDEIAQVNAHLLATRSLLEAGTRDGERLRLSRELHDVAGHSLTALKLNLELALRLPEAERAAKIAASRDLVDALLDDIRAVVGQLRQHDGVDLAPALRALTERLPGPRIELDMDPELRVAEVAQAEAVLRCVQESLTNAVRHAEARSIRVQVRRDGAQLRVEIVDDGRGRQTLLPGHGLTGMRERIEEAGGRIAFETAPGRGFRVLAELPIAATA
jgi:signal transduction histidine kinase